MPDLCFSWCRFLGRSRPEADKAEQHLLVTVPLHRELGIPHIDAMTHLIDTSYCFSG